MSNKCTHERMVQGYWESKWEENWYTGEMEDASIWHPPHYESTTTDVDLHRYKCTQCDKIFYYSSYGRSLHGG